MSNVNLGRRYVYGLYKCSLPNKETLSPTHKEDGFERGQQVAKCFDVGYVVIRFDSRILERCPMPNSYNPT